MTIIGSDTYVHRFNIGVSQTDSFVFDLNTEFPFIVGIYTEGTTKYTKSNITLRANKTFVDDVHLYFLNSNNGVSGLYPFKPTFDRHSGKLYVEKKFSGGEATTGDQTQYYLYVFLSKKPTKQHYIYKGAYISIAPSRTGIMDIDIDLDPDITEISALGFYFDYLVDLNLIVNGRQMFDRQPLSFYTAYMKSQFLVPCEIKKITKLQVRLNTTSTTKEKHINAVFQVPVEEPVTIPDKKIFIDKKINDERFLVK